MGPKEGEILILEKNDEEQSCLFYWDLSDALSLVKISPQIKKLIFLDFIVFQRYHEIANVRALSRILKLVMLKVPKK